MNYLYDLFDKKNIYNLLGFKSISLFNGLVVSIPNEEKSLNPLHQDIYAHYSKRYVKIWITMSKVNEKYGGQYISPLLLPNLKKVEEGFKKAMKKS